MSFIIEQGGGSLNNIEVPKGLCKYLPLYNGYPYAWSYNFANDRLRFQPAQTIQIYQDTVIETIKYYVTTGSATDVWYCGLYKYDLPNDKYVKQCQWDMATLSVAGAVSQTLATPITIGPGTYFIGVKSKDATAWGFAINSNNPNRTQIQWHKADTDIAVHTSRINYFQINISAALTVLPTEILNSSPIYYNWSGANLINPYLVY